jgi:hypothetical protein
LQITDIIWKERVVEKIAEKHGMSVAEAEEAVRAAWTARRETIMADTNKHVDPLPDEFRSEEEAAECWNTHSITDYEEFLEPVGLEVDLKRRHFEIEVDEESFLALRDRVKQLRKPAKELASEILKQKLATV